MFMMFVSAAVWDQAFRFGKEKKRRKRLKRLEKDKTEEKMLNEEEKKIEEGEQEEAEEIPQMMRDMAPPSEPAPTSSGPETMETRAGKIRTISDVGKSKESRVGEDDEESSEFSDTSEEEVEKENTTVPVPQTSAANIEQVATPEESLKNAESVCVVSSTKASVRKMQQLPNEVERLLVPWQCQCVIHSPLKMSRSFKPWERSIQSEQ